MNISKFVDSKLEYYRDKFDGKLDNVDSEFIYAYGPFMCMNKGYERECDEIAIYNPLMKFMVYGAYLARKINSGITYKEAKNLIRDFIVSTDNNFSNEIYKKAMISFAQMHLNHIRNKQQEQGHLESFMVCASPIVPYTQTIKKKEIIEETSTFATISRDLPSLMTKFSVQEQLETLLLSNLAEILFNYHLCTVLIDDNLNTNFMYLDKLIIKDDSVSIETQKYYFLATVHFYKLYDRGEYEKYIQFFEEAGDFSKTQSYSAFESMINSMASSTSVEISLESLNDPTLDDKEENAVSQLINSYNDSVKKSSFEISENSKEVRYNFGVLNDFISLNRYIKFEEFPNRLFLGSLEKSRVINVNNMGMDRDYYEMDNDTVACPFLDLRDYRVRVIVLHAITNKIEIINDIRDMY